MMRKTQILLSALLLVLLLAACAPSAAPAPQAPATGKAAAPAPAPAAPLPAAAPAIAPWQEKWEKTLAAARQEGRLMIYTQSGADVRTAMMKIAKMQGIDAEILSMRTAEIWAKTLAERRAGLYLTDLHFGGAQSMVQLGKPAGALEKLESAFILPDLTEPDRIKKVWYQGTLPWVDQDHTIFAICLQPGTAVTINTDLVRPDEVKSWRDILDPKWRGKVAFNDPTVGGYGQMAAQVMTGLMGEDYVKELANTKPIILRDQRQLVDWLAHGKLAIAIAAPVELLVEFLKAGAPIKAVVPKEGTWLGAGNVGNMVWFKNSPHPNASKVYINWISSKEGQEILVPSGGFQSTRDDVSTAHLLPGLAREEGAKYFPANTEESYLKRPVTDKLAKDLFGPLIK